MNNSLSLAVQCVAQQGTQLNSIINWGFWSKDAESDYYASLEDESPYFSLTEKE